MAKEKNKSHGFRNLVLLVILLFIAYWFFLKDYVDDFLGPSTVDDPITENNEVIDDNSEDPVIIFSSIYDDPTLELGSEFNPWDYVTITYNGVTADDSMLTLSSNLDDLIEDNVWGDEPNTYTSVMFWVVDENGYEEYFYMDISTVWGNDLEKLISYLESISTSDGSAYIDGFNGTNYYNMYINSEGVIHMSYVTNDDSYPYGPFVQYGWYLEFEHGSIDTVPTKVIRYYQMGEESSADVNGSYVDGSFYYSFYSYDMSDDVLNEAVTLTGELMNEMFEFFETTVYLPADVVMR